MLFTRTAFFIRFTITHVVAWGPALRGFLARALQDIFDFGNGSDIPKTIHGKDVNKWGFQESEGREQCGYYSRDGWCSFGRCPKNHSCDLHVSKFRRGTVIHGIVGQRLVIDVEDEKLKVMLPLVEWPIDYKLPADGETVYYKLQLRQDRLCALVKVLQSEAEPLKAMLDGPGRVLVRVLVRRRCAREEERWALFDTWVTQEGFQIKHESMYAYEKIRMDAHLEFRQSAGRSKMLVVVLGPPAFEELMFVDEDDSAYRKSLQADGERDEEDLPFKAWTALNHELCDIERRFRDTPSTRVNSRALQPRSTGAFEDFARTVLLDGFTRLARCMCRWKLKKEGGQVLKRVQIEPAIKASWFDLNFGHRYMSR